MSQNHHGLNQLSQRPALFTWLQQSLQKEAKQVAFRCHVLYYNTLDKHVGMCLFLNMSLNLNLDTDKSSYKKNDLLEIKEFKIFCKWIQNLIKKAIRSKQVQIGTVGEVNDSKTQDE